MKKYAMIQTNSGVLSSINESIFFACYDTSAENEMLMELKKYIPKARVKKTLTKEEWRAMKASNIVIYYYPPGVNNGEPVFSEIADMLVEPIVSALMQSGLTMEQAYKDIDHEVDLILNKSISPFEACTKLRVEEDYVLDLIGFAEKKLMEVK